MYNFLVLCSSHSNFHFSTRFERKMKRKKISLGGFFFFLLVCFLQTHSQSTSRSETRFWWHSEKKSSTYIFQGISFLWLSLEEGRRELGKLHGASNVHTEVELDKRELITLEYFWACFLKSNILKLNKFNFSHLTNCHLTWKVQKAFT